MTSLSIDREFVTRWSIHYIPPEAEQVLLNTTGPEARASGYLTKPQLIAIGDWKSHRTRSRLAANTAADVEILTGLAFQAPAHVRHRVLSCLAGVSTLMASAILTVVYPDQYTVIDIRARTTLRAAGYTVHADDYWDYLQTCTDIAHRLDVDLRSLDRALWSWDRTHNGAR